MLHLGPKGPTGISPHKSANIPELNAELVLALSRLCRLNVFGSLPERAVLFLPLRHNRLDAVFQARAVCRQIRERVLRPIYHLADDADRMPGGVLGVFGR